MEVDPSFASVFESLRSAFALAELLGLSRTAKFNGVRVGARPECSSPGFAKLEFEALEIFSGDENLEHPDQIW